MDEFRWRCMQVANRRGVVIVFEHLDAGLSSLHHTSCNGRSIVPEISIACNTLCVGHLLPLTCTLAWHEFLLFGKMREWLGLCADLALLLTLDFGLCRFATAIGTGAGLRSHKVLGYKSRSI